jgi:hypothetical protein
VRQVTARGDAEVVALDGERARRKLVRYLGPDEDAWDERFQIDELARDPGAGFVCLAPQRLVAKDLSFRASS